MKTLNLNRLSLWVGAVVVALTILAPASEVMATDEFHVDPGRQTPWTNCNTCHGADLLGGFTGVSCFDCHQDFGPPDPPPTGHHDPPGEFQHVLTEPRKDPVANGCTNCHGDDLLGDIGPSCFSCHDQLWDGGSGNSPPVVDPGGPYVGPPGVPMQFDASGTFDPDGDPMIYLWDFGDGSTPQFPGTNPTTTHVYENVGTYTARLTVTDGANLVGPIPFTVEITDEVNLAPSADAGGPYSGIAGQPVDLDASGSSDPEGDTLTYSWDFGDGSQPSDPSSSPTISHTYQTAGDYTAVVSVSDGINDPVTAQADVEVIEPNFPPVPDAGGPYSGEVDQPVDFDASGTFDLEGDVLTCEWDFGDGCPISGPTQALTTSHAFEDPGVFIVALTVRDGVNDPVVTEVDVEISEAPLPPQGDEGDVWLVDIPFLLTQITVSFQEFAGILLVETTYSDGSVRFGIGMEFDGLIFWMDPSGALFIGNINDDGTIWGIVFGYNGGSSAWFAELL
ncbi:MAG: cytochrome c3 family protein [Planctomycetota bacterium]